MTQALERVLLRPKTDRAAYDALYGGEADPWAEVSDLKRYAETFRQQAIAPLHRSGATKGHVRGLATNALLRSAAALGRPLDAIRVVDAGCGHGQLSIYLAALGFQVTGIDISEAAVRCAGRAAGKLGIDGRCRFLAESLEATSLEGESVDFIIGHASLHHFIKYAGVPAEFARVLKPQGEGFFADSFSENALYHFFQDKRRMQELGDVRLTEALIRAYFRDFEVQLTPTDWFLMLDKLLLKLAPRGLRGVVRGISRVNFALDRRIPTDRRWSLYLAGAVFTRIRKRPAG